MAKHSSAAAIAARLRDAANLVELIERLDAGGLAAAIEPRAATVVPPAVPPAPAGLSPAGAAVTRDKPSGKKPKRRLVRAAILAELRRDATRSNDEIARVVGCHRDSVYAARRDLDCGGTPAGRSADDDQEDSRLAVA